MKPHLWPSGNARVLHAIAPGPVGGAESAVLGLTAGLVEAGVEVVLAVLADASSTPFIERARAEGRQVEVIDAPGRNYARDWSGLRRMVRAHDLQLVHTHGYRADMMGFLAARLERRPVVSTAHGFTDGARKNRVNQWLALRALVRDDAVIAVSAPLAIRLASMGVPADRIHTIPNAWRPPAVQALDHTAARARLGLDGDAPTLGWVGRLSHVKGADIAIAALATMRNKSALLVFVGDGPDRPALEAQAKALGVASRVRFVGMVPQASSVLPAFDTLVLSSRSEGTPMILLETIHAGVPIVASAVGGVPDLLPAGTALLVAPNDPAALGAAMDQALADPAAARRRATAARAHVAGQFSPREWVSRHLAVYQRVMERRVR
jgi:glycosyltransferase involved in cell wall biosynthesis